MTDLFHSKRDSGSDERGLQTNCFTRASPSRKLYCSALKFVPARLTTFGVEDLGIQGWILYRERNRFKLPGNEVDDTNSLTLLVKNMLCSKLHCQKVLRWKLFPCKIPWVCRGATRLATGLEGLEFKVGSRV